MILRRIALTLVLVLFATVTVGVILGLPDAARSELAVKVVGTADGSPEPDASSAGSGPSSRQAPSSAPATDAPTPKASAKPSAQATQKPTARASTKPTPKPTAKPKATSKPTAKPKASTKPTAKPNASTKAKAKTKKSSKYLSGPLKKGSGGTVYLTFDDGPSPYTASILSVLTSTGSTATFFHLGVNEPAFPHADAAIRKQGSKVGNHSYDHPDLTLRSKSQLTWQLAHGPKAKCFRPPYGATNSAVRKAITKAGMRQVLWSIDTLDWSKPGVPTLAKTGRLKAVQNGSIILMHDGGGDRSQTVASLRTIIGDLHARGYKVRALPYC